MAVIALVGLLWAGPALAAGLLTLAGELAALATFLVRGRCSGVAGRDRLLRMSTPPAQVAPADMD